MFRMWETFKCQKAINNITWKVPVDVGFRNLVRLHFPKPGFKLAETVGVMFKVYINEMIANTDSIGMVKGDGDFGILWFRDYIVVMKGPKQGGRRELVICLQMNDEIKDEHASLEAFEVIKLSNLENSLVGPSPLPPPLDLSYGTVQKFIQVLYRRKTIATMITITLALVNVVIHGMVHIWEASFTEEENMPSARAGRLCRRFSLAEIEVATRNFSKVHLIEKGGFGKVYKGFIDNGRETVAIKRLKLDSSQGAREFLTEIETLTVLRHVNLVSLIGYCNEHGEMILVYDYVACGTLADHLRKVARKSENFAPLTWKQRLKICIGAGRGLDYLHTGHSLIHRDVKASNILLDENFVAKVSDFGLVKYENRSKFQSHVSTDVKGTVGYLDPYYCATRRLTRESDTYAFGVVLLEVLFGRSAMDRRAVEDEQILSIWALKHIRLGRVRQVIASCLRDEISENSLKAFMEIVQICLHDEPKERPKMAQVVLQLEFALEQQDSTSHVPNITTSEVENDNAPHDCGTSLSVSTGNHTGTSTYVQRQVVNAEPSERKDKVSRLWPWNAFRNRSRPGTSGHRENTRLMTFTTMIKKREDLEFLQNEDGLASFDVIGRGECGDVYKVGFPVFNGQKAAVKRIVLASRDANELTEEDIILSNKKIRQIQSEIRTIGVIRHRNILPLLAVMSDRYCHHMVYMYMKNGSLPHYLGQVAQGRRELEWSARYNIALGVASALEYLHMSLTSPIIHRDLKPENILLDDELEPRITGFGFAVTTSDIPVGYNPPEYQTFNHNTFSDKWDMYNLGVVLGVLVMGKLPSDPFFRHTEMSLVKYMRDVMCSENKKKAIDPRLSGNGYEEEMEMLLVLELACFCTMDDPKERPNAKDARNMLAKIKHCNRGKKNLLQQGFIPDISYV